MRPLSKLVALLLSLVCAGAAEAGGKLSLVNVRATYGIQGPVRTDNKYLPGDKVDLSFDIDNITVDPKTGQAKWEIVMDVLDPKKKSIFNAKTPSEMVVALGGRRLPAFSYVTMTLDSAPGNYTMRVTVTDKANKATATYDHKFVVLEKGFGMVKVAAQSMGFTGQPWPSGVSFEIIGMQRDKKELFDVHVSMRIFDDKGKPTLQDPLTGEFPKDLPMDVNPKTLNILPVVFPIELTRPGRFRVEIEATDRLAKNKKSSVSYNITVVEAGGK
jgi:hypothetical protein